MTLRVGVVGCGNISDIYMANAPHFRSFAIVACADIKTEVATKKADTYGLHALSVDDLVGADDIDVVLNLTVPDAHAAVSQAAIAAGKHVYSEKPLATRLSDGRAIVSAARARGVRVGAAPDTVLGANVQLARQLIDDGEIGTPLFGLAAVLSHGMEAWHPNPAFFYRAGGGPVLDLGPYYIATLVTLLGPVARVQALSQIGNKTRIVGAEGPTKGSVVTVSTPTTVLALLQFASGAQATFTASWDAWASVLPPLELHGTDGSMQLADPNWFGGDLVVTGPSGEPALRATDDRLLGRRNCNYPTPIGPQANYRGLGLAEMADAILGGRPHRANGEFALHILAVMEAIASAAETSAFVEIVDTCERPQPLTEGEGQALFRQSAIDTNQDGALHATQQ